MDPKQARCLFYFSRASSLLLRIPLKGLSDSGFLLVAFVENDAMLHQNARALGQSKGDVVTRLIQGIESKWVRGKQAVISDVPRSWMIEARRMIQYRHTHALAIHQPVVIHPGCSLAPSIPVSNTFAIDNRSTLACF